MANEPTIPVNELVALCAVDDDLYAKTFFPKTARVEPPVFHREMDSMLNSTQRLLNFQVFRGGAKTTKLRLYVSKRIAYGVSKTILYVSKSQGHAGRNLMWLRKAIERNERYANTFNLRRGDKWNDEELQIHHGVDGDSIWVTGMGITGSTRGINFDDYRPDLIIVDDVVDDENATTDEQRLKTEQLVHGALRNSLISRMENPLAKMVILQTPMDFDDISEQAFKDPEFKSFRYGCWTKETEDLPIDLRQSSWPALFPAEDLRAQRAAAIKKNKLSTFSREMECRLITPETSKFKAEWLKYFGEGEEEPEPSRLGMVIYIVIDPVPPPSERQISKGLADKDYEAFAVVGRKQGKFYALEMVSNKGHEPNWTVMTFFKLCQRWNPRKVMVETVAYQKTLEWLLRQAMRKAGRYWVLEPVDDKRSKMDAIVDGLSGPMSEGQVFIRRTHQDLASKIIHYPNVKFDDDIEAFARAVGALNQAYDFDGFGDDEMDEENIPLLSGYRGAP